MAVYPDSRAERSRLWKGLERSSYGIFGLSRYCSALLTQNCPGHMEMSRRGCSGLTRPHILSLQCSVLMPSAQHAINWTCGVLGVSAAQTWQTRQKTGLMESSDPSNAGDLSLSALGTCSSVGPYSEGTSKSRLCVCPSLTVAQCPLPYVPRRARVLG